MKNNPITKTPKLANESQPKKHAKSPESQGTRKNGGQKSTACMMQKGEHAAT